jgi:regulator of protease activity HflC (stomatin/prohibitin superfamily)
MKKLLLAAMIVASTQLSGCVHPISTDPSTETVLVDKPYIFGHGGVQHETQKPGLGWYWWSTEGVSVPTYDFKVDEPFDDLPTKKASLVDFSSYIKLRITDPVKMVEKFRYTVNDPMLWYNSSIKVQYQTIIRNVSRNYTMEEMITDSAVVDNMERDIRHQMEALIKEIGIPVVLVDVSLGSIRPNKSVMDEIDRTSTQQQRIKTEEGRREAEESRKAAENARAEADKIYQSTMNLTPAQITELQVAKMYSDACLKAANCILSSGAPVGVMVGSSK